MDAFVLVSMAVVLQIVMAVLFQMIDGFVLPSLVVMLQIVMVVLFKKMDAFVLSSLVSKKHVSLLLAFQLPLLTDQNTSASFDLEFPSFPVLFLHFYLSIPSSYFQQLS